jgi:DNA-binding NtrC family response regulator
MMRSLKRKMTVNIEVVKDILKEADISPRTCEEVERLFHALEEALRDLRLEDLNDIASYQGHLIPGIGASGSVNVIPGKGHGSCARIVLAIAQGASAKSKSSIPNVVREIRAHLIHCTEKTEVAILLTDQWNEKLLKESEPDFAAYASRPPGRRKVLIPVVVWKGQMTVNPWP